MPDTMSSTGSVPGKIGPLPDGHPAVLQGKIGVLLVNLGTPDGTDYWSMRRYLSEFLSDPRVIEVPQPIWQSPVCATRARSHRIWPPKSMG